MGSITPACAKAEPCRRRGLNACLLGLLLGLLPALGQAQEFTIERAATQLVDDVYVLDADVEYELTDPVLEALSNGVPLILRLDIDVIERRAFWLDQEMAELEQRYRLNYHALADQYLVRNLNSGAVYSHPTLGSALRDIGRVRNFPLIDDNLVEAQGRYEVRLRASLDIEELPSPLRPLAYITPAWRLDSDRYTWPLTR